MSLKSRPLHPRCNFPPKTTSDVLAGEIIPLDARVHTATAQRTTYHCVRKFLENVSGRMNVFVCAFIYSFSFF